MSGSSTPRKVRFSFIARKTSKMRSRSMGPVGYGSKLTTGDRGQTKVKDKDKDKPGKRKLKRRKSFSFSRSSRHFHSRSRSRSRDLDEEQFPPPTITEKQKQFGTPVRDLKSIKLAEYDAEIPEVLVKLKDYLSNNNGVEQDGIFRVNPGSKERDLVKTQLNAHTFTGCDDIHCISNMIKVWFRDLPTRIFDDLDIEDVTSAVEPNEIPRTTRVSRVILAMHEPERSVTMWLLDLCILVTSNSDKNRMTPRNMAIVIAPNLWEPSRVDPARFMALNQTFTDFFEQAIGWRAAQKREQRLISDRVRQLRHGDLDDGKLSDLDSDDELVLKKRVSFGNHSVRMFDSDVGSDSDSENKLDERGLASNGIERPTIRVLVTLKTENCETISEDGEHSSEEELSGSENSRDPVESGLNSSPTILVPSISTTRESEPESEPDPVAPESDNNSPLVEVDSKSPQSTFDGNSPDAISPLSSIDGTSPDLMSIDSVDADSPKADADSPKADADSPKADADSPKADADSPKADADSPKADADSPKAYADSPKADTSSNSHDPDSSSQEPSETLKSGELNGTNESPEELLKPNGVIEDDKLLDDECAENMKVP